ncbi:MAG TPA: TRIC cation channel family protein [Acidimicrobiia bacterium]|nr:TRIC cation channel family protein [Acidimicrobiia bacterium]
MDVYEVLVWLGTITFAVTGALVAVSKGFDVVGILILGSVTAIGGGSVRDLIAGVIPPTALTDEPLLWAIVGTCFVVFFVHRWIPEGRLLYGLDTLGLAVFASLGAATALSLGFGFWGTVFAGVVSGVGGGVIRDVLAGEIPGILYRSGDFYATAAAGAAGAVFLAQGLGRDLFLLVGVAVGVGLRVGPRMLDLRLPVARTDHLTSPDALD